MSAPARITRMARYLLRREKRGQRSGTTIRRICRTCRKTVTDEDLNPHIRREKRGAMYTPHCVRCDLKRMRQARWAPSVLPDARRRHLAGLLHLGVRPVAPRHSLRRIFRWAP